MLLSAVSVLVVAQSSSEIPEGLMNNPVYTHVYVSILLKLIYINCKSALVFSCYPAVTNDERV